MARLLGRRGFLRTAAASAVAVGATGALSSPAAAAPEAAGGDRPRQGVPPERISIQLYTVREQLEVDLAGTLKELGRIGYTRVETAGFFDRTAAQFKALLDAAGLRATSNHFGIPQPFDAATWRASLADALTLGSRYVVHPYFGTDENGETIRDTATWRAFAQDLNRAGRMARDAGLSFGYHNHQREFLPLADGNGRRTPYDVLTEVTDPALVHLEVDLYWAWRGAEDPVDLIRQNPGRVRQFHVKDMNIEAGFADPGQGLIDFARIFRYSERAGVEEYIVERDDAGSDPRRPIESLETARVGYEFLRRVRFSPAPRR